MAVCRHADRQQSVDMRDFTGHVNLSQECYCRRSSHWGRPWSYLSPAIVAAVILGITGLIVSSVQPSYKSSWDTGQEDRTASAEKSKHHQALVIAASSSSDFIARLHTPRHLPLDEDPGDSYNEPLVGGLLKRYSSFAKYVLESSKSDEAIPLPLVVPIGHRALMSIPIITIIGVQKGGTTNLRRNLLTHPYVSGMPNEVHFFDRSPETYPRLGRWPGDGNERDLSPGIIGRILSEYAFACLEEGKPINPRNKLKPLTGGVIVESSPRYILCPLAPYRMRMVRPDAKLVVVLRDPTERYFSQLRMFMCKAEPSPGFASIEEMISTYFHPPGGAQGYLERGSASYEPYSALCRGENATSSDLWHCYKTLDAHNPLQRGLYADQLERWFRVYDRSQIMVVDSSEMFVDFTGTLSRVATFAGLPQHDFEYDPKHEFKGSCPNKYHRYGPDFFAEGGRYDTMLEEEELFREWYRPHNERLSELLGREMMW